MSENIKQIFDSSPATSFNALDLMYLGRSPYSATDDFAFTYSTLIPVNTKGDLFAWSTAATKLAVGSTNGQILQVSSPAATGLAWSTATYPSTNALGDVVYSSATNVYSNLAGNITISKLYLSQTGTGAVSAAPAWSAISGSDITGAALSKTDDTNVTMTLGGSPTTALLRAASMTLGWTGQLALTRGGTNASLTASNGGIVYSTATALAVLAGTATAGQIIRSGSNAAPSWSTATYPATTTINQLLYSSSANTITGLATANRASLVTGATGVPVFSSSMADGQIIIGSSAGVPAAANITAGFGIGIANSANGILIANTAPVLTYMDFTTQLYNTGTASQSGTTITGVGTTFTSGMVGGLMKYVTGEVTIIAGFVSTTQLIAADSMTVGSTGFQLDYSGLTGTNTGNMAFSGTMYGQTYKSSSGITLTTTDGNIALTADDAINLTTSNAGISLDCHLGGTLSLNSGVLNNTTINANALNITAAGAMDVNSASVVLRPLARYGILCGGGTSNPLTSTVLTDGQLLIGSTGTAAVASTLTAGNGVTIDNAAGSITINASDSAAWVDVQSGTIVTNLEVDTGYSINSGASLRVLPLPTSAAVGTWIQIDGNSTGLWKVTQNASQVIHVINTSTTVGTGGSIQSTAQWGSIKLRCVVANTEWVVESGAFAALTIV